MAIVLRVLCWRHYIQILVIAVITLIEILLDVNESLHVNVEILPEISPRLLRYNLFCFSVGATAQIGLRPHRFEVSRSQTIRHTQTKPVRLL